MNKLSLYGAQQLLLLILLTASVSSGYAAGIRQPIDQLVVQWGPEVSEQAHTDLRTQLGITEYRPLGNTKTELWQLPEGAGLTELLNRLNEHPAVEWAEPNYRRIRHTIPDDPSWHRSSLWGLEKMQLPQAWEITTGSHEVVVAVLDDSLNINHPDLRDNIWSNPGEIPGNGIDDDGNGYVDDYHGWDFKNGDNDPTADPGAEEGHGTMVAGAVGAVGNNGTGITGAAWKVSIMPLKFGFDVASGLEAAQYAINQGADILVASFGGPAYSYSEDFALQQLYQAGVLVVVSAGNDHADNDRVPDFPANSDYPNILSVAASREDDALTEWSNHGQHSVDLMAPGSSIYTTQDSGGGYFQQEYGTVAGTSFSAPYVAGVAALVKSVNPSAGYHQLKGRILASVDEVEMARGHIVTSGRVNGYRALTIEPQPLLQIRSVHLENVIGDGDTHVDSAELLGLLVVVENGWLPAEAISARLSTESQLVDILWDELDYPDLDPVAGLPWSAPQEPFLVYFRPELDGHHTVLFKLELMVGGKLTASRYFQIEVGALRNGVTYQEVLQQDQQEDFHSFHINFPHGASGLSIETTVENGADLDLMLAEGEYPQYLFDTENGVSIGPMTTIDGNESGNEQLLLQSSSAETIDVVIVNFSQYSNQHYTIRAEYQMEEGVTLPSQVTPTGLFRIEEGATLTFPDHGTVIVQGYQLTPGWNLISLPVAVQESSIQLFLQQFPEVASIWSYRQEGWVSALQALPWEINTLKTFNAETGYWIKVDGESTLHAVVAGIAATTAPFPSGWNLFGVSTTVNDPQQLLQQYNAQSLWSWSEGEWRSYHIGVPIFLNSLRTLYPGKGYYLYRS